ncbi:hypothetical protein CVT26_014966 [Gymnopilus dilepis]|uniref:Amidohydrolase-related domain-containing protein n=1 Tax=Gymnopilus dilepis TaxID=231916 RepID=A0A409YXQ7_9AGAR|nr:hypothetical protein CVT26_014966 [Gymnopilus dilepis]
MPALEVDGDIVITNVRLPYVEEALAATTWIVECRGGRILRISPQEDARSTVSSKLEDSSRCRMLDAEGGIMLPSFCHSHIHLDKCFILDQCGELVRGDFPEAMEVTRTAKAGFPNRLEDLYNRGARLIRESVLCGVTAMRAHVEVDTSVGFSCLDAGLKLQGDYRKQCDVQISVFAQEALFDSLDIHSPGQNYALLEEAASRPGISVVGSAPYVEPSVEQAKENIALILNIADRHDIKQVDFHLDYNLDSDSEPLIYEVIRQVKQRYSDRRKSGAELVDKVKGPCPLITIGHATRLQLFSDKEWRELATAISDLPIIFVGLPQSDMYMQGRAHWDEPLGAPRGTLRVPYISRRYGIDIAMSVNNVDNAFTPQGSLDPLSLCTFGVSVFQAATTEDIRSLARSVTLTSKRAIGQESVPHDLSPDVDDPADFVILHGQPTLRCAVLNPGFDRTTIKAGKVVASRRSTTWFSS